MSKHETTFSTDKELDPDLVRRTESAILTFMAEHDGRMPTVAQVNAVVRTSFTRLGPAVRVIKDRLLATQTRLASTPDIPEDLRLAHEQVLKDMWARTRDLQNGEISDLRRAQAAKDDSHRQAVEETQEIIALVEADRDGEKRRADAAEAENAELKENLGATQTALAEATARLAERDSILAMLAPHPAPEGPGGEEGSARNAGKTARRSRKTDEPETADLPMGDSEPSQPTIAAK